MPRYVIRTIENLRVHIFINNQYQTMRFTQPGMSESSISAHFEYLCKRDGAQRLAYVPVVASGSNGRIIHYTSNNHMIQSGETLLIDAACEYKSVPSSSQLVDIL